MSMNEVTAIEPAPVVVVAENVETAPTENEHTHIEILDRLNNIEHRLIDLDNEQSEHRSRLSVLEERPTETEALNQARDAAIAEVAIIGDIVNDAVRAGATATAQVTPDVVEITTETETNNEPEPEPTPVMQPDGEIVPSVPASDVLVETPSNKRNRKRPLGGIW